MRGSRDETFTCRRCGERFTVPYARQRDYRWPGQQPPAFCPNCYQRWRNEQRSSMVDHPPYAAPLPHEVYEWPEMPEQSAVETAVSPPPSQPTTQPNWWDKPINRYNLLLFILVLLAIIVFWFILQAM